MWIYPFISFECIPRSEIAGPYGKLSVSLNTCKNFFQSDCPFLHSCQQYVNVPISPHPHKYLSSVFLIITILWNVKCCLIVVLICISLMANVVFPFMCLMFLWRKVCSSHLPIKKEIGPCVFYKWVVIVFKYSRFLKSHIGVAVKKFIFGCAGSSLLWGLY